MEAEMSDNVRRVNVEEMQRYYEGCLLYYDEV